MFNYQLSQIKKSVISAAVFIFALLALFIAYDPGLEEAVITLIGALFAVIGVFGTKNATPDDWSKAVQQLQGAALSVVGFFVTIPADTVGHIGAVVLAGLSAFGVWYATNHQVQPGMQRTTREGTGEPRPGATRPPGTTRA